MKLFLRPALALVLGTALAASLSSCDYHWSPGANTQFHHGFTNPPGWHKWDVNRDSINNQPKAIAASGEGSAIAIKKGTVKEQLDSAPAGNSAATTQDASGQLEPSKK